MAWNDHQWFSTEIQGTLFITAQSSTDIQGSFNLVPFASSLVLRVSVAAEAQYLPRYSLVDEVYVPDEDGDYVQDPDNPGEYIELADHPTGGKYPTYLEALSGSGVTTTDEN